MNPREDFVRVRLTPAGADGGGLRVVGATYDYAFGADDVLEMPRAEFEARLMGPELAGLLVAEPLEG